MLNVEASPTHPPALEPSGARQISLGKNPTRVLITGGCGFIGAHLAMYLLEVGARVIVLDNLSRRGARENLAVLESAHGNFRFCQADLRCSAEVDRIFRSEPDCTGIIHEAAQVAVTTSVADPRSDFETNALGTFNVLEAARQWQPGAALIYASTNKVYGDLTDLAVDETPTRYRFLPPGGPVSEQRPLDFHSPYGCSKGSADQYFRDYHRIYGLNTTVIRQSCIYGTRQFGIEDQGWVAWFTLAGVLGWPITIYGDGKQVRDILWIDDLIELYMTVLQRPEKAAGKIYNAGGGEAFAISLRELLDKLRHDHGLLLQCDCADWRPGDQKIYISDCSLAQSELGWAPRTSPDAGIAKLVVWARQNEDLIRAVLRVHGRSKVASVTSGE